MNRKLGALLGALTFVGACKTTTTTTTQISGTPVLQPAPAVAAPADAVDPTGRWTLSLSAQGQGLEVVLEVVKLPAGGYGGSISSEAFPTIPITKGTLEGKRLTLTFPVPTGGDGSMILDIDGTTATGEWAMQGDGSKVAGKKG